MRKFTTEHTVYSFDELSSEAKEKALQQQREYVNESINDYLPDTLADYLPELLKKHGMKCDDPKIWYSLNYSQGDGAMFEGIVYWKSWQIDVRQHGMYYHYNAKQFWNIESVKTGREPRDYDKTERAFNDEYVAVCQELEKYGYDEIENQLADENLIEDINANGYEFYADGRIA